MSEPQRNQVNVSKNELPLQPGQSVSSFTRELGDMVKAHLFKKLGLDKLKKDDHPHVWMNDTFSDTIVAEVSTIKNTAFYAVGYARDTAGVIKLGDPVEVVRRVNYVPKTPTVVESISKCAVSKSFWAGVL